MSRYPNAATRRFDQQFAETTAERNARLRKARRAENGKTLNDIRQRFAYQEAERFVTGHEEDIRFLLSLVEVSPEMIERAAQAIYEVDDLFNVKAAWHEAGETTKILHRDRAKAALRAAIDWG